MSSSAAGSKQKKQKTDSESHYQALCKEFERKLKEEVKEKEEIKRKLEGEVEDHKGTKRKLEVTKSRLEGEVEEKEEIKRKLEGEVEEKEEIKRTLEKRSLYLAVYGEQIPTVNNMGSDSAHLYPTNHPCSSAIKADFKPNNIIGMSKNPNIVAWMKNAHSFLMAYVDDQNQKGVETLNISNEADIQALAFYALQDAINLNRKWLSDFAAQESQIPNLMARREMSIFSNKPDHAVIYDLRSEKPIVSIEAKKFFNNTIRNGKENRVFGQSYDQLRSMKAKGHPTPFAAITSFAETYITWLPDENMYKKILESHHSHKPNRFDQILQRFHRKKSLDLTQSPPKTESPSKTKSPPELTTESEDRKEPNFTPDSGREIMISDMFESNNLVSVYTNVIFCALDATFAPLVIKTFGKDQQVEVNAIEMTEASYQWGILTTTIQGPLKNGNDQTLYLLDFLGAGATSVVYRALTIDGYECAVKLIVDDGDVDRDNVTNSDFHQRQKKFKENSKQLVEAEIEAYKEVYGDTLHEHVWQQKLNKLDCIVMPFFEPIPKEKRKEALESIGETLETFRAAKMMFKECDQLWRHVGLFNGQTFLYDLGDLDRNLAGDVLDGRINDHLRRLQERAGMQDDPSTPTANA